MNMMKTAACALLMTTTIITIIITQMKCSQALALRPHTNIRKQNRKSILDKLANDKVQLGTILRSKGIVASEEGDGITLTWFQGSMKCAGDAADYTGSLCVIGCTAGRRRVLRASVCRV